MLKSNTFHSYVESEGQEREDKTHLRRLDTIYNKNK
jgi:hypothetical protein